MTLLVKLPQNFNGRQLCYGRLARRNVCAVRLCPFGKWYAKIKTYAYFCDIGIRFFVYFSLVLLAFAALCAAKLPYALSEIVTDIPLRESGGVSYNAVNILKVSQVTFYRQIANAIMIRASRRITLLPVQILSAVAIILCAAV